MTESSRTGIELVSQLVQRLQACATLTDVYAVANQACAEIFSPLSGSISIMRPPWETLSERVAGAQLEDGPLHHLAIIVAAQVSMTLANLALRDSLGQMAIRDPLTGLFNRRYMEETLDRELNRAARSSSEVAIVMIDVDHFTAFNAAHGHDAGDTVLAAVGEVLRRYSRTSDVACRFGGQEFLMILPDCSLAYAGLRADELRRRVSALYLCSRGIELPGSTVSCGVAVSPMHGHRPEDIIVAAGTALYTAKRSGRDKVALAPLADTHTMTGP